MRRKREVARTHGRKPEVDRPLRSDVRSLGWILGDVLIEQEGEPLYALGERVRKLACD